MCYDDLQIDRPSPRPKILSGQGTLDYERGFHDGEVAKRMNGLPIAPAKSREMYRLGYKHGYEGNTSLDRMRYHADAIKRAG